MSQTSAFIISLIALSVSVISLLWKVYDDRRKTAEQKIAAKNKLIKDYWLDLLLSPFIFEPVVDLYKVASSGISDVLRHSNIELRHDGMVVASKFRSDFESCFGLVINRLIVVNSIDRGRFNAMSDILFGLEDVVLNYLSMPTEVSERLAQQKVHQNFSLLFCELVALNSSPSLLHFLSIE